MSLKLFSLYVGGAIVLALAVARLAKRAGLDVEAEIDLLVAGLLSERLGRKLDRPEGALLAVLSGRAYDPGLRQRIETCLRAVELTFRRIDRANVELRIDVTDAGGEPFSAVVERRWEELPARVREAFLRTGQRVVSFPWRAPWLTAE